MTPEGRVKAKLKRRLAEAFPTSYRFMPVQNGMGAPALDLYCCICGLFVAAETKAPGKALTDRQEMTSKAIRDAGGLVFKVDGDDDIERMIVTVRRVAQLHALHIQPVL
jgi:hypothetical protein